MAQYENLEGWEKLSLGMQLDKWAIRYGNRIAVTERGGNYLFGIESESNRYRPIFYGEGDSKRR